MNTQRNVGPDEQPLTGTQTPPAAGTAHRHEAQASNTRGLLRHRAIVWCFVVAAAALVVSTIVPILAGQSLSFVAILDPAEGQAYTFIRSYSGDMAALFTLSMVAGVVLWGIGGHHKAWPFAAASAPVLYALVVSVFAGPADPIVTAIHLELTRGTLGYYSDFMLKLPLGIPFVVKTYLDVTNPPAISVGLFLLLSCGIFAATRAASSSEPE